MRTNRLTPIRLLALLVLAGGLLVGCASDNPDTGILAGLIDPTRTTSPAQAALNMLDMDNADNRRTGVAMIAGSPFGGEEVYLKVYRELIRDPEATVRAASARALGLHGSPDDAELLARAIDNEIVGGATAPGATPRMSYNEPDPLVRWEAAKSLQKIHNTQAVRPLVDAMLRDTDGDVRAAAAAALGQYADPIVYDALLVALTDPQYRVVRASQESLTTLTGQDLGNDPDDWVAYRETSGEAIFADQQLYTYRPWVAPPRMFDKFKFWTRPRHEQIQPQVPAGL